MPILDGHASVDGLPSAFTDALDCYGDGIAAEAVRIQREKGTAIDAMLGIVVLDEGDLTVGVALAAEISAELLESVPAREVERMRAFLARPTPPGHLRLVVWLESLGIAIVRVDTVPTLKGGRA